MSNKNYITCGRATPTDAMYLASAEKHNRLMPTGSTSNKVLIGMLQKEQKIPQIFAVGLVKMCKVRRTNFRGQAIICIFR